MLGSSGRASSDCWLEVDGLRGGRCGCESLAQSRPSGLKVGKCRTDRVGVEKAGIRESTDDNGRSLIRTGLDGVPVRT